MAHLHRCLPLLLALFVPPGASAAQQPTPEVSYPPAFEQPIQLYAVLGPFSRKITTRSPEAQAFFDQGVKLVYSFTLQEGARSFREAQKRDPECAMCYFGEAWSWGPYLNGAMSAASAPRAYAAIQQAVRLREKASPVERALIDAMALRYTPVHDPASRARMDTAYSAALEKVYAKYSSDLDVGTLYAESLMLLNRNRGTYEVDQPLVKRFHAVLDKVLDRDMHHPGACHLYIHATEATSQPERAEMCATHLGSSIPGASHINHMPSHTFNRIGRWGDAVRANIEAWHSDLRAESGGGIAIYPTHNLLMLLYSAAYDGQGAIATQAARDYEKLVRGASQYRALTLVRFGRFDEVLELRDAPTADLSRAQWDFARGYSHLRRGAADSARWYLARVDSIGAGVGRGTGGGPGRTNTLLQILGGILRAELLLSESKTTEAIAALEAAADIEDEMAYAEPEALPFAVRHWLGAALLVAKRPADAERVYREDLADHTRNGWSLYGLAEALTAQGKTAEAVKVRAQLAESWVRSDTWLRGSRF
jgi:tetratricopeptide (TPR) repeat protein